MPKFGLGTWMLDDPEECVAAVTSALDMGYRHVDTAQAYGNEQDVGDAIDQSSVDRDEVFLATKVWIDNLAPDDVVASTTESLDKLGVDGVDLLYVHWPAGNYEPELTLAAFDDLVDRGLTDRIGVSNFQPDQLATAVSLTDAPIFAHQFECHPLLPQDRLLAACDEHDVRPVAYSPLARGRVFDVPAITEVAEKHGVSEAQVSLAWLRHRGLTTIPKASSRDHVYDNWQSLSLRLDDEDVAKLDGIDTDERLVDPDFAPWQ
ncbi:aldo/keto reductase [Haloarculaceae archaeon H-GB2-1]|nr:aldo/keto reductase [Haloarculaceae archaeon H-GB1-1]MEA5389347.1 aldo/keto reductase [Haloarculaceae archaeon H-GB11]MEA5409854.1 aldo/keto reductase [Haloarculaceae archaeon H-GB2-1]